MRHTKLLKLRVCWEERLCLRAPAISLQRAQEHRSRWQRPSVSWSSQNAASGKSMAWLHYRICREKAAERPHGNQCHRTAQRWRSRPEDGFPTEWEVRVNFGKTLESQLWVEGERSTGKGHERCEVGRGGRAWVYLDRDTIFGSEIQMKNSLNSWRVPGQKKTTIRKSYWVMAKNGKTGDLAQPSWSPGMCWGVRGPASRDFQTSGNKKGSQSR